MQSGQILQPFENAVKIACIEVFFGIHEYLAESNILSKATCCFLKKAFIVEVAFKNSPHLPHVHGFYFASAPVLPQLVVNESLKTFLFETYFAGVAAGVSLV